MAEKNGESLPYSGERFCPELAGNIALEHLHRYALARLISGGKCVLDIACGEGYGSAALAEVASQVIGVDISSDVVTHASGRYHLPNLEFKVGNCDAIPMPDGAVDLVVSFETLEHHDRHAQMISELKRVMVPNGVVLISTPDTQHYSAARYYKNRFHVKELDRQEFKSLLGSAFQHVAILGQRVVYGSAIFHEEQSAHSVTFNSLDRPCDPGLSGARYLLALASDGELPEIPSSLFVSSSNPHGIGETVAKARAALKSTSWRLRQLLRKAIR